MKPNKKILVTGATGFLGAYLVRYLVQQGEYAVRAIKRPESSLALLADAASQVEWVDGDVLDVVSLEAAMKGVQKIYHCAAVVSFNDRDKAEVLKVNREGTTNIVNLCLDLGIEKLLHVSSIAALGRRPGHQMLDEQSQWQEDDWNTPYAVSKHLAEMEVWRGVAEGLNAVMVNPANILGSGYWNDRVSTGQMFYKIWKGLPFYPAGGTGFVDVRDVVKFMYLVMESDLTSQRIVVSSENLPFQTVFEAMANSMQVAPPRQKVTPLIREAAWRAAWIASKITGKPAFITRQAARSSSRAFSYSNQQSLAAFPKFSYRKITETIQETGAQFLECADKNFNPAVLPFRSSDFDQ